MLMQLIFYRLAFSHHCTDLECVTVNDPVNTIYTQAPEYIFLKVVSLRADFFFLNCC